MSDPISRENPPAGGRLRLQIHGIVQGVGFRPCVYRLALELDLSGWVQNTGHGVVIELEGPIRQLEAFRHQLPLRRPAGSYLQSIEVSWLDPIGDREFSIRPSLEAAAPLAFVRPDVATCPDCLRELFDPRDRRYRYPFINCTYCGPRFTIIQSLPYDRPNTSMRQFAMCPACHAEYHNPKDRRFHAQPNACPACGPHLEFWDANGTPRASHHDALETTAAEIRRGRIIAVKGLGGFHLFADARNGAAVNRLRERKRREEKPFALMFPSLEVVRAICKVSEAEADLLQSPAAPIVLLERIRSPASEPPARLVDPAVAPGNPALGIMLPYTPLHHLLMAALGFPVVATSGNLADEPICIDENDARRRLSEIADGYLVHNRPIVRHVDDSIARFMAGRDMILRRARGFAPLPIPLRWGSGSTFVGAGRGEGHPTPPQLSENAPGPLRLPAAAAPSAVSSAILALGAQLKNTIALLIGDQAFLSQHIGDLETVEAVEAFQRVIADFQTLYARAADLVVCDLHPDYFTTQHARRMAAPTCAVQHHYAHVLAAMAENDLTGSVLGVSWDGTGYGLDHTVWGGEFLVADENHFRRFAWFLPFPLPGGERAIREPRRAALGLLFEALGPDLSALERLPWAAAFTPEDLRRLLRALERRVNSPLTSSVGRLFDAVASIVGRRHRARFEGQAAMELEWALGSNPGAEAYPIQVTSSAAADARAGQPTYVIDWRPMLETLLRDVAAGIPPAVVSARFHNALVESIVQVAQRAGQSRVALTGGCFQNKYLLERAVARLRQTGFQPYWHQRVPPNDGGIALGQALAGLRHLQARP